MWVCSLDRATGKATLLTPQHIPVREQTEQAAGVHHCDVTDVLRLHQLNDLPKRTGRTHGHCRLRHQVSDQELGHDLYFKHVPCQAWSVNSIAHIMRFEKP